MGAFYANLFVHSILYLPSAVGSNALGLVWPVIVVLIGEIIACFKYGWKKMISKWKSASVIGLASLVTCYTLLFLWCGLVVNYDGYASISKQENVLQVAYDTHTADERYAVLKAQKECAIIVGQNDVLGKQNRDQQNSINNCQTEAIRRIIPDPEMISPRDLSGLKSSHSTKIVLLQTNTKVGKPATVLVKCDAPIKNLNGGPVNTTMTFMSMPYQTGPSEWAFVVLGPPEWVQGYPLIVQYDYDGPREPQCGFGRK